MKNRNLTFIEVDMRDVRDDLIKAIYMLHYLETYSFSRDEVREVAFSLCIAANSIDVLINEPKSEDHDSD